VSFALVVADAFSWSVIDSLLFRLSLAKPHGAFQLSSTLGVAVIQVITGFHRDHEGQWVAELACGHTQHVRHEPPWQVREWTQSESGRQSRLGSTLDCPLCNELSPTPFRKG
jgi:hypothetical protein